MPKNPPCPVFVLAWLVLGLPVWGQGLGPRKLESQTLPNLVQVHQRVISGGVPAGDAAFAELARRGVKTIISVDGATPDLATAHRYGLRYVHLPHGYDGIPPTRVEQLAKAVRDLDGPIYVHCHHGKHRSPVAATAACVAAGMLPAADALDVLELAGTDPSYRGLFDTARRTRLLDPERLDSLSVDFSEVAEIPPLAEAMVALDHTYQHLLQIQQADWSSPADHPDLAPAHEARLLREHFTEMLRIDRDERETEEFRRYLQNSEAAARRLEAALRSEPTSFPELADETRARESRSRLLERIRDECKACHVKYRDTPRAAE